MLEMIIVLFLRCCLVISCSGYVTQIDIINVPEVGNQT